jgi:hypothetical protein
MFELAVDGVPWNKNTAYSSQFFVLRCKDAPPSLAHKMRNVQVVLIVPGPSEPKSMMPFISMVQLLFSTMGARGGMPPCNSKSGVMLWDPFLTVDTHTLLMIPYFLML